MLNPREALERLQQGNRRFASNVQYSTSASESRRRELVAGQEPFAVILGCSDSRVPAETVFDQGLGDLFVIRVAGNIVARSQIASVEFAVENFGTRLVVVLGHSNCGAVMATINLMRTRDEPGSESLVSIIDRIRPAVAPLLQGDVAGDPERLIRAPVRANVRAAMKHLASGSEVISNLIAEDGLMIVGAEYLLETGVVEWLYGCAQIGVDD